MMPRFFAAACLLGSLGACAAPRHPVATAARPALAERGTILAVRPVPRRNPRPVRVLLAQLGGGPPATGNEEFIVRREDGGLLAVVQPEMPGLRPGRPVLILPGKPPRIGPLPSMAER